jgi:O-antigen ligase
MRLLLAGMIGGGIVAIVSGAVEAVGAAGNPVTERFGGLQGIAGLGLVAGLVTILSLFGPVPSSKPWRLILASAGCLGLLLAKSVGALVGVAVIIGVGLLWSDWMQERRFLRASRIALVAALIGLGLFAVVRALRAEVLPSSPRFGYSTASHRVIVLVAGLEVFVQEPLFGVGWQRSSAEDVIGSPEVASALRERFRGVNPYFLPDIAPTSVHNAYVQILAELGLFGFIIFLAALDEVRRRSRRLVRSLHSAHPDWPLARALVMALLFILVWWNDSAIFGGQAETVAAATLLGCLASLTRSFRSSESVGNMPRGLHGRRRE